MIAALAGCQWPRVKVVEEQTASDILQEITIAHRDFTGDYDRIADFFQGQDIWEICEDLWQFCKRDLYYKVESVKVQNVGSPYWILTHGIVDCKNYASFIGGVLDALKRRGYRLVWEYRFVSYKLKDIFDCEPEHVFIVVNPNTDDIWVDPVLDTFNYHLFYWYKQNKRIRSSRAVAGIGCAMGCGCGSGQIGMSSVESGLLADLKSYADGLSGYIAAAHTNGTFNQVAEGVLMAVAVVAIPGAALALAALKAGAIALDKEFGVGAASSRILTDISNLNISGLINDIFSGRTYQSDQYWAGVYYKFYVLGQNVTDPNFVSDSDVLPALKWFIDKSGVYISGREHIIALTQGPQQYSGLHAVNGDTTTDGTLVNAASLMAKKFWPAPGNFDPSLRGAWKNTVGVYDLGLVQLANQLNTTPEALARQTGTQDANAAQYITAESGNVLTQQFIPGIPNWALFGAAGLLLLSISSKK